MEIKINQMKSNLDENMLKEETLTKVKSIISMDAQEKMEYDKIIIYQLKMMFYDDKNLNGIKFPNIESSHSLLLSKLIELIIYIINNKKNRNEREKIYGTDINVILSQKNEISKIITELKRLEDISFDIKDELVDLYNILSEGLDKKEVFSLYEYIDSIILSLSFVPQNESILKYQIYSYIIKYYLAKFNILLGFSKDEINISDKLSIDLICYLFTRKELTNELLTLSVIILNYNSLKDCITRKSFEQIVDCIKICTEKTIKYKNTPIFIEKIMAIFSEELDIVERRKKKKNNKKGEKKREEIFKKEQNSNKKSDNQIIGDDDKKYEPSVLSQNKKDTKEPISESGHKKDDINLNCDKSLNYFLDSDEKINIYFNTLINKIKMGNKEVTNEINEIRDYMITLVRQNNTLVQQNSSLQTDIQKIKDENEIMKTKMVALTAKMDSLFSENKIIKNSVNALENDYEEIKFILGEIQFRKLSKNFLHYVKSYLIENNYNVKGIDKESKGEIFSKYMGYLFPNANKKKLAIVQSLIEKSADLANDGDFSAHSLYLDYYYDEIKDYKVKKGLDTLYSYEIFCYLVNLNISEKDFDDAFSFLRKFFTKNLRARNKNIDIFSTYFN